MENIDITIIERLGEHQRKAEFIHRNLEKKERRPFYVPKASYVIISIAACIALLIAVSPMLFQNDELSNLSVMTPSFTEFRSGSSHQLESLIMDGEYSQALTIVKSELSEIDKDLDSINRTNPSDEDIYLLKLFKDSKEELEWCKIYLLLKLENKEELEICCQEYLNNTELHIHDDDAKKILKKIH